MSARHRRRSREQTNLTSSQSSVQITSEEQIKIDAEKVRLFQTLSSEQQENIRLGKNHIRVYPSSILGRFVTEERTEDRPLDREVTFNLVDVFRKLTDGYNQRRTLRGVIITEDIAAPDARSPFSVIAEANGRYLQFLNFDDAGDCTGIAIYVIAVAVERTFTEMNVGYASVQVHPQHRRKKIGSRLLSALIEDAMKFGVPFSPWKQDLSEFGAHLLTGYYGTKEIR